MESFDYHFKIRDVSEQALNLAVIYKNLAYNNFDKNKLLDIFNVDKKMLNKEGYLRELAKSVEQVHIKHDKRLSQLCKNIQMRWDDFRDEYIKIISKALDMNLTNDQIQHLYCYMQLVPINELDLTDGTIYLNTNKGEDEVFSNFIVMLTKRLLLDRWSKGNGWKFNTDFDSKNKVFLFADIAVNAIFASTKLSMICSKPSYKYFYNLLIENKNIMDEFTQIYQTSNIEDFFDKVYMFVYTNYQKLLQFKHYLY